MSLQTKIQKELRFFRVLFKSGYNPGLKITFY